MTARVAGPRSAARTVRAGTASTRIVRARPAGRPAPFRPGTGSPHGPRPAARRPDVAVPARRQDGRAATRARSSGRWVPFDEGDGRGKDRPVLVIGRRGRTCWALMLSSQDHDRDAADEARHGRHWTDLGTGAWDARGPAERGAAGPAAACSTRPTCAGRARRWTGRASTGSSPRPGGCRAGDGAQSATRRARAGVPGAAGCRCPRRSMSGSRS